MTQDMKNNKIMQIFCCDDIRLLPEAILKVLILNDRERRDVVYKHLLEAYEYDLSYDWFQGLYESELSQRKEKKQDFTPNSVGVLASMIADDHKGVVHEPTAGNGSMLIADCGIVASDYCLGSIFRVTTWLIVGN